MFGGPKFAAVINFSSEETTPSWSLVACVRLKNPRAASSFLSKSVCLFCRSFKSPVVLRHRTIECHGRFDVSSAYHVNLKRLLSACYAISWCGNRQSGIAGELNGILNMDKELTDCLVTGILFLHKLSCLSPHVNPIF